MRFMKDKERVHNIIFITVVIIVILGITILEVLGNKTIPKMPLIRKPGIMNFFQTK